MTIVSDEDVLNICENTGDWTSKDFSNPALNDDSSTIPIFREGTGCMAFILKKGVTDGHFYDGISSKDFTGKVFVFWWFIPPPDLTRIPLDELWVQISSDSGYTTDYGRWDALSQITDLDLYGWTPILVYCTNPDEWDGSPDYPAVLTYGWTASTGGSNDGKLAGFDMALLISYLGGHSQTVTLTDLFDHAVTNDHGVVMVFGDFYRFNVNIRLGDASAGTHTIFNQDGKTIFFDNVQPEHNLGFIFINETGETYENRFKLINSSVFWNEQNGTTPKVFTDPGNLDEMQIEGCQFSRGGAVDFRTHVSDSETYCKKTTFNNCRQIDPRNMTFEDCTINNSKITANNDGAVLLDSEGTGRWSGLSFIRGSSSHAIIITATGTYTFTNFSYSGYGANGTDTAVIRNESGGEVTIIVSGGDTPTYQNGSGASTSIEQFVTLQVTAKDVDGNAIQYAQVVIRKASSGAQGDYTADTGNDAGDGDLVVNEVVDTDIPQTGWCLVWVKSLNEIQPYRYASWSGKTFTFNTEVTGTADTGGSSTVLKRKTGTSFLTADIEEGDTVRNTTDGSWGVVDEIVDADTINLLKPLQGGSDNAWQEDDGYSFHKLATTLTDNDDAVDIPLMNMQTNASGVVSKSYNYSSPLAITVLIRSSSQATKYVPYPTSGTITADGYTLEAVLTEDEVAT